MLSKKAELTSTEVVKIVLAVMGILLLIYLSVSLYGIFTQKAKLEQARINLENIIKIAESLNENQVQEYLIESPKDWDFLFFYGEGQTPLVCRGLNCLCFCDGRDKEDCDEKGICKAMGKKIIFDTKEENFISLDEIPQQIFLKKLNDEIIFSDVRA